MARLEYMIILGYGAPRLQWGLLSPAALPGSLREGLLDYVESHHLAPGGQQAPGSTSPTSISARAKFIRL